jgi:putative transposase
VKLDDIRPGKPTDNGFIESFNSQVRQECLSQHYFSSIAEARLVLGAWREDYNIARPHSALGQMTPAEFRGAAELPEDRRTLSLRGA